MVAMIVVERTGFGRLGDWKELWRCPQYDIWKVRHVMVKVFRGLTKEREDTNSQY